jgi:hypothetical protein
MTELLRMLREERASLRKRLAGMDAAIRALEGTSAPVAKRRAMSTEARAKISAAAKKRWAKSKR